MRLIWTPVGRVSYGAAAIILPCSSRRGSGKFTKKRTVGNMRTVPSLSSRSSMVSLLAHLLIVEDHYGQVLSDIPYQLDIDVNEDH